MATSIKELKRLGYSQAEIAMATATQAAEGRAGTYRQPRSLIQILTGRRGRPQPFHDATMTPEESTPAPAAAHDLITSQLRGRSNYIQAALLLDQEALSEENQETAATLRDYATKLRIIDKMPRQREFEFFMGNTSTGHQFLDAMLARLSVEDVTIHERAIALATLTLIVRWIGWQTHACERTGTEIAAMLGMDKAGMTRTLHLLERIGAIKRIKDGQRKIITITPDGAYRGKIAEHAATVKRYNAQILQLPRKEAKDAPAATA